MGEVNALSLIKRHDGSYFYLVELGYVKKLYKYLLVQWDKNKLAKPYIIYSHTKRSKLTLPLKEFFDNNLLNPMRLKKYFKQNNIYIGGIEKIQNLPVRVFKEGINIPLEYKIYERNDNYLLIEANGSLADLYSYNIYYFQEKDQTMNFNEERIYTEKDLFNLKEEETFYVLNNLLDPKRVENKIKNNYGYVGTVEKINNVLKRKTYLEHEDKLKKIIAKQKK